MSRIHCFIILLLAPFSLLAQNWEVFNDTSFAFTAHYPPNWINKIKEGKRVFFTSPAESEKDNFFENVNISMTVNEAFGSSIKFKDVIPSVLETLSNTIDNFTKTTERYFLWNKSEACELIYTGNPKGSELEVKIIQWFGFSKGRLFTATYTSESSNTVYLQPAIKILKSIVFH